MRRVLAAVLGAGLLAGTLSIGASAAPAVPAGSGPEAVPNELLVGYVEGATSTQRARARAHADVVLVERVVRGRSDRAEVELVRVSQASRRDGAESTLEDDPAVEYAEPNWIVRHQATSADTYFTNGQLWGMYGSATSPANQYGSQAAAAWANGHTGSAGVYVGVIDEGIQYTHPDLAANIGSNPGEIAGNGRDDDGNGYIDDVRGWDFANNDSTVYDGGSKGNLDKHGTHVSGTIGAASNGAGVVGVNWTVKLLSGKFLGRNGGTIANAVEAVDYFTDLKTRHGLNIVATNNSWGGGGLSQALLDAIGRAANEDILFIAAAGNGGSDGVGDNNDAVASYPSNYNTTAAAGYDAVIAVAAITSSGGKSSFSNYGATTVDLGAPGSGVYSTLAGNKYGSYSGTSMATPHVTGAAALYAATHAGASAADIKSAIISSAVPTASLSGKAVTGGRLNVSGF